MGYTRQDLALAISFGATDDPDIINDLALIYEEIDPDGDCWFAIANAFFNISRQDELLHDALIRAQELGIGSYVDALAAGVPIEDILA